MINKRLWIVLAVLVMAALACNLGKSNKPVIPNEDVPSVSTEAPSSDEEPAATTETGGNTNTDSEFPMPEKVSSLVTVAGVTNFQTTLSLKDALAFYQDALSKKGYKERSLLTVTTDTTFNLVFDGHESGKAIVVQGVDLGNGSVSISISLQDLP